jgi:hypothetical protein
MTIAGCRALAGVTFDAASGSCWKEYEDSAHKVARFLYLGVGQYLDPSLRKDVTPKGLEG